jgi:acetyl esterase/lipase
VESQPNIEDLMRRRIVYSVPGMADVKVREGQPYKNVGGSPLLFDLYAPHGAPKSRPAVILIHGGPIPQVGARRAGVFVSYGELLAASGFVGIAFDHRFLAPDQLPTATADVTDLVSYVRTHAVSLGIDAERLALWAFSGGGSLLSAVLRERPRWCKLAIAYYAVMEPLGSPNDERVSAISALGADASNAPPLLIARAGQDDPAINATIDRFVAAATARNATVDFLTHPTGHHAFDILDANERSREIIGRTVDALRSSFMSGAERNG